MINFETTNTFQGGKSNDLNDQVEKNDTFEKGINGRIYSHNGVYSFSAIKGSKLVYENPKIVKFLGFNSFTDETIVFAKVLKPEAEDGTQEVEVCEITISTQSFQVVADVAPGTTINLSDQFLNSTSSVQRCYTKIEPVKDYFDFETPYSSETLNNDEIDFSDYYNERVNVDGYALCPLNKDEVPINNELYFDAIYSFKIGESNSLVGERIWIGAQKTSLVFLPTGNGKKLQ